MRTLLFLNFFFILFASWAQPDTKGVWVKVMENTFLKSKPASIGYDLFLIKKKNKLFITDVTQVDGIYKILYDDHAYYISKADLEPNEKLDAFVIVKHEEFNKKLRWILTSTAPSKFPSVDSEKMPVLKKGTRVLIIQQESNWFKVSDLLNVESENGWIPEDQLSIKEITPPSWDELRKETYLTQNNNIEEKFKTSISNSEVIPGMNREMVKASLGPPDKSILKKGADNEILEIWVYDKISVRVELVDTLVISCAKFR